MGRSEDNHNFMNVVSRIVFVLFLKISFLSLNFGKVAVFRRFNLLLAIHLKERTLHPPLLSIQKFALILFRGKLYKKIMKEVKKNYKNNNAIYITIFISTIYSSFNCLFFILLNFPI
jgi:hypothetical protein